MSKWFLSSKQKQSQLWSIPPERKGQQQPFIMGAAGLGLGITLLMWNKYVPILCLLQSMTVQGGQGAREEKDKTGNESHLPIAAEYLDDNFQQS